MPLFKNRSFLVKMVKDEETSEDNTLEVDIDEVRGHFRKHRDAYLFGTGVVVAGITFLIMRGKYTEIQRVSESGIQRVPDGFAKTTILSPLFLSKQTNNVVTVIQREGRGHPGYLVKCLETNEIFPSQDEAARQLNAWPSIVSGHLSGKIPDVHGKHLERIAV